MARRRPPSYAWAFMTGVANRRRWRISPRARQGLAWAEELALADFMYARAGRDRDYPPGKWDTERLARQEDYPESTVIRTINQARFELFGSIKLSAIYARKRRWRVQPPEVCAEPGCEHMPARRTCTAKGIQRGPIPRYCEEHARPAARTARSRRKASD